MQCIVNYVSSFLTPCVHGLLIRPGSWHGPSEFSLAISVRANAGNIFTMEISHKFALDH